MELATLEPRRAVTTGSLPTLPPPTGELHPLADFYRLGGREMPPLQYRAGDSLPEPARTLLYHERDMTRTLEAFHGRPIHLRLLSSWREGQKYGRESVLELEGSNRPVEFGAIWISLAEYPVTARAQILEEHRPLGGILNASGLEYVSRPSAFFSIQSDGFITEALHLSHSRILYGRRNTLRTMAGVILAQIVEILPPHDAFE